MMLWFTIGLPAVYLGIGGVIAGMAFKDNPPFDLWAFFAITVQWPRIFWL